MEVIRKSSNLEFVHSDIRGALYVQALKMEAEGKKVLKLNTGNPAAFGFKMPQSISSVIKENLDLALGYCDVKGMANAREAIAKYHLSRGIKNVCADDVYICNGVSETVSMALTALLSQGDEILVPSPCYSLWSNSAYVVGAKPVLYMCDENADWNPDLKDIEKKITDKTKAIVIINPNNPTGAVYSKDVLEGVLNIARKHNLVVFSDEIYDRLILDDTQYCSTAALCDDVTVITMNGLSKSHCLCGFRCGWMIISGPKAASAEIREGLTTLASVRLCSNAVMQLAIPTALEDEAYTKEMIMENGRLMLQRQAVMDGLDKIDGISYVKNSAAFYLLPKIDFTKFNLENDRDFAAGLLREKNILIVPSSGFLYEKQDRFRIVMLPKAEVLKKAMEDIGDFLDSKRI